jgi:hypothetical protein
VAQALQLAATAALLRVAVAPRQPLPPPWFEFRVDSWSLMLGGATAIAATGGGVLLLSALQHISADGEGAAKGGRGAPRGGGRGGEGRDRRRGRAGEAN